MCLQRNLSKKAFKKLSQFWCKIKKYKQLKFGISKYHCSLSQIISTKKLNPANWKSERRKSKQTSSLLSLFHLFTVQKFTNNFRLKIILIGQNIIITTAINWSSNFNIAVVSEQSPVFIFFTWRSSSYDERSFLYEFFFTFFWRRAYSSRLKKYSLLLLFWLSCSAAKIELKIKLCALKPSKMNILS